MSRSAGISYRDVFKLESNFTMQDLNQAYDEKIKHARRTMKNELDKQIYLESIAKFYEEARKELYYSQSENDMFDSTFSSYFNDMSTMMNNTFKNFDSNFDSQFGNSFPQIGGYTSSSSYKETTLPDGSKLIIKNNTTTDNGEVKTHTNSYRRLRDGTTEPVDYEEAIKQLSGNEINKKYLM